MPRSPASARSAGMSVCRRSRRAPTRSIRADPRCATTATAGAGPAVVWLGGATAAVAAGVRLAWEVPGRYRFERTVRLDGPTVRTDYRMTSLGPDMPFLWSMHPLLALEPGRALVLGGVAGWRSRMRPGSTWVRSTGPSTGRLRRLRDGRTTDLSRIAGVEAGTALKAYARAASLDGPAIAIQPDGAGLAIEWDRQAAPFLGVWIDAGGWPAGTGRHQVALEPTTAPHDDLASAVAAGSAAWARVDHDVTWWTTLRLVGAERGPDPTMTRGRAGIAGAVDAWAAPVVIPTYPAMPADRNPMFLEKRVYQGSSGRVYPNRFTDRVSDERVDRTWQAVHLENEYVRLMILPEIGGRIHVGQDRTNGYDFFYRQHVIKPALVGLLGPWISGGVEFNWPQHHRPSTFMPVDWAIEEAADGSRTVWLSEHEPMDRMKGMVGIRLRPGSSLVEARVRLANRTPHVQTFLWWANVGVRVHDRYQSFFPPDVTYVADHARRAMSRFPVARGTITGSTTARDRRPRRTSRGTPTSPCRPRTWRWAPSRTSSADTTTRPKPASSTSRITASRPARSSGRGGTPRSDRRGTAT